MTPATLFNDVLVTAPSVAQIVIPQTRSGAVTFVSFINDDTAARTVTISRISDAQNTTIADSTDVITIDVPAGKSVDKKVWIPTKGGDQIFIIADAGSVVTAYVSGYYTD